MGKVGKQQQQQELKKCIAYHPKIHKISTMQNNKNDAYILNFVTLLMS